MYLHVRAVDADLVGDVPCRRQALEDPPPDALGSPSIVAVVDDGGGPRVAARCILKAERYAYAALTMSLPQKSQWVS